MHHELRPSTHPQRRLQDQLCRQKQRFLIKSRYLQICLSACVRRSLTVKAQKSSFCSLPFLCFSRLFWTRLDLSLRDSIDCDTPWQPAACLPGCNLPLNRFTCYPFIDIKICLRIKIFPEKNVCIAILPVTYQSFSTSNFGGNQDSQRWAFIW